MNAFRLALLALMLSPFAAALTACDEPTARPDATVDADAETDAPPEIFAPPTRWSDDAILVQLIADQTLSGDLADGAVIDLSWADQPTVNCWTFSDRHRFAGPHVFYALAVPLAKTKRVLLTLTPDPGVDASSGPFRTSRAPRTGSSRWPPPRASPPVATPCASRCSPFSDAGTLALATRVSSRAQARRRCSRRRLHDRCVRLATSADFCQRGPSVAGVAGASNRQPVARRGGR
jgi:hypothetical protein